MNPERKALSDLLVRLHGMGVTSAPTDLPCPHCDTTGTEPGRSYNCFECKGDGFYEVEPGEVMTVLGEMMNVNTPGISMSDVLTAAKAAGVY